MKCLLWGYAHRQMDQSAPEHLTEWILRSRLARQQHSVESPFVSSTMLTFTLHPSSTRTHFPWLSSHFPSSSLLLSLYSSALQTSTQFSSGPNPGFLRRSDPACGRVYHCCNSSATTGGFSLLAAAECHPEGQSTCWWLGGQYDQSDHFVSKYNFDLRVAYVLTDNKKISLGVFVLVVAVNSRKDRLHET